MRIKAWAAAAIARSFGFVGRLSLVCSQRVEPLEYEPAVIAQELVQAEHADKNHRIIVIALNSLALASRALHRPILAGFEEAKWYTYCAMRAEIEDYFLNPPPGSAAARAVEFGIDLTLTLENLRLTPEQRIRKLESFIEGVAKLKASVRIIGPTNATTQQHH